MEVTGLDECPSTLRAIVNTFEALKAFANFELSSPPSPNGTTAAHDQTETKATRPREKPGSQIVDQLRFSHNIYINLPDTTDVVVFNAIFKAIKDHLLS